MAVNPNVSPRKLSPQTLLQATTEKEEQLWSQLDINDEQQDELNSPSCDLGTRLIR